MRMSESDWKKFRKVRAAALERLSQSILDECEAACNDVSHTAHERYLQVYDLIDERSEEMAGMFDDCRRSTAVYCLMGLVGNKLVTQEELSQFSPDVQRMAGAVCQ